MSDLTTGKCKATNRRGEPCQAPAGPDGFCYFHSPARAADRRQSRSRGGRARHGRAIRHILDQAPPPAALRTVEDMREVLEYALSVALALEPSFRQVSALVAIVGEAQKLHVNADLRAEMDQVNERMAELLGGTNGKH